MQDEIIVSIVTDENIFKNLHKDWDDLIKESEDITIFQTWEWNFFWWKHYKMLDKNLYLMVAKINYKIVGIAPLFIEHKKHQKTVKFLGGFQTDYKGFILSKKINKKNIVNSFFNHIQVFFKMSDFMILEQIPDNFEYLAFLRKANGFTLQKVEQSAYIKLPGLISDMKNSPYGNKNLKTVEYYRRKLYRLLDIHLTISNDLSREDDLNAFFNLHRKRWITKGTDGVIGSIEEKFHFDVSKHMLPKGYYKIFSLKLGETYIACKCCLFFQEVMISYLSGFDPCWSSYRPGSVLNYECVCYAIKQGLNIYDFGIGIEDYKLLWHPNRRNLITLSYQVDQ